MNRNGEAHATCLNILHDNKDSAPRIAELCTFARLLGSEVDALRTERDRLAAENAEWKAAHAQLVIDYEQVLSDLESSDATLDALRKAVPEDVTGWTIDEVMAAFFKAQHKLYPQPKETGDDEQ